MTCTSSSSSNNNNSADNNNNSSNNNNSADNNNSNDNNDDDDDDDKNKHIDFALTHLIVKEFVLQIARSVVCSIEGALFVMLVFEKRHGFLCLYLEGILILSIILPPCFRRAQE